MMMPLTKPPPLMTTFFHRYGQGAAASPDGAVASPVGMLASPEYGTGGVISQVPGTAAPGASDADASTLVCDASACPESTHATPLPSHAATATAIAQPPTRAPATAPVLSATLTASMGEQVELTWLC